MKISILRIHRHQTTGIRKQIYQGIFQCRIVRGVDEVQANVWKVNEATNIFANSGDDFF